MSQNNKPNTDADAAQPQDLLQDKAGKAYQPPRIVSSKIFHKVLLATPQPGIPGCDTGYP